MLLDSASKILSAGATVRVGRLSGVVVRYEHLRRALVNGDYTGNVIVAMRGREETFPAFVSGRDDVCYDLTKLEPA